MQPGAMQVSEGSAQQAVVGTLAQQDAGAARRLPPAFAMLCGGVWSRGV
jgi:hypothetical protein